MGSTGRVFRNTRATTDIELHGVLACGFRPPVRRRRVCIGIPVGRWSTPTTALFWLSRVLISAIEPMVRTDCASWTSPLEGIHAATRAVREGCVRHWSI